MLRCLASEIIHLFDSIYIYIYPQQSESESAHISMDGHTTHPFLLHIRSPCLLPTLVSLGSTKKSTSHMLVSESSSLPRTLDIRGALAEFRVFKPVLAIHVNSESLRIREDILEQLSVLRHRRCIRKL